jgi:hypothetical protein
LALALMFAGLMTAVSLAQDAGAALMTIGSVSGTVVITRADGSSEPARSGATLLKGDRLATVGRSEVQVNFSGEGTMTLMGSTTVDFDDVGRGAGGFFVSTTLSSGVSVARTAPSKTPTISVASGVEGAVAKLQSGGMAIATDLGLGNVSVACEGFRDRVFFPYEDTQMPCESRIVRTLTSRGAIDDDTFNGSFVSAVVDAVGQDPDKSRNDDANAARNRARNVKEKESDNTVVSPSATAYPSSTLLSP